MNTSVEGDKPIAVPEDTGSCCDASCSCNAQGVSHKAKIAICLLIGVAAIVVILLGSAKRASTAAQTETFAPAAASSASTADPGTSAAPQPGAVSAAAPAAGAPVTAASDKPPAVAATKPAGSDVWGPTLTSLSSLNEEAADKDAVFVFVPAKDGKQTGAIRDQVAQATKQAQSRGQKITAYMLSSDAEEYADITGQVPAPCVLAMAKGAGAAPVSGDITEAKLLAALVTASRPSSCGPSGCGPSGCN